MSETTEARFFVDIDALQDQGISAQDIKKLKESGYATIKAVLNASRKHLTAIKGLSEVKVDKIKSCAIALSGPMFKTATDVMTDREKVLAISTGSKSLDTMLGGGIQSQSMTEVYGEFRCGKTQLCHTLCITTQLPVEMGGGGGKVAYIDTEGTFRPERIRAIADRFNMDSDAALDKYAPASRLYRMELIVHLAAKFAEDGEFRLLIVDSILALFRVDYSGRGELADRQQKLNQMLARLTRISEEFNVAIFLTNQVQSDPGASSIFAGGDKRPVGGHVLAHASATRIYLRKGRGDERVAKLADSPDMPEGEASYKISAGGIEDC